MDIVRGNAYLILMKESFRDQVIDNDLNYISEFNALIIYDLTHSYKSTHVKCFSPPTITKMKTRRPSIPDELNEVLSSVYQKYEEFIDSQGWFYVEYYLKKKY